MAHGTFNWSTVQIVPPFKLFPHSTGPQIQDNLSSRSLGVLWTPFFVSWLPLFCLHNYWTLNNPHAGIPCMTHRPKQKLYIWLITLKRCSSKCYIIYWWQCYIIALKAVGQALASSICTAWRPSGGTSFVPPPWERQPQLMVTPGNMCSTWWSAPPWNRWLIMAHTLVHCFVKIDFLYTLKQHWSHSANLG